MLTSSKINKTFIVVIAMVLACSFVLLGCGKEASAPPATEETTTFEAKVETPEPLPSFSPDPELNASEALVGLLIPNTKGLLTRMAQHGFLRTAENLGYPAIIYEAESSEEAAKLVDKAIEDGCKGLVVWADSPPMLAAIAKARAVGLPVVVPYYETSEEGVSANLVPDVDDYAPEAARILCAQLENKGKESGIIVICGADFEPEIANAFEKKLADDYPKYSVVRFEKELTEENIAEFIRKHSELAGVLALDQNSGKIWSKSCENVQAELRTKIRENGGDTAEDKSYRRTAVILVLDYTEAHLAWVRDGLVFGVIARPYYDSTAKSMAVLDNLFRGIPVQTEVRLDAPVIRKNAVDKYVAIALEVKEWFNE